MVQHVFLEFYSLLDRVFFETDDSGLEIGSIYQGASLILQIPVAPLAEQVVANWNAISN